MNTKKTIAFFAIAMAVAFVASVGMASAVTLYADNSLIDAGTVTVSDDGTDITITYTTTGGWELTAYHIYVSDVAPTKSAPGQFPFKEDPVVPATTSCIVPPIPLPDGRPIYIAAQADLRKYRETIDGVDYYDTETGWGDGTQIRPGKNWAMYFTYIDILDLQNKDPGTWEEIIDDEIFGILEYKPSGPTFEFVFDGQGLDSITAYSLIYYADPWPGDNPGALIASGTSDADGNIHLAGSTELGMDLPDSADANYPDGAKIWLVPSSNYDDITNEMIGWNPTKYLYEHNLITYDDTDV